MAKKKKQPMPPEVFNRRKKVEQYLRRGVNSHRQIAAALGVTPRVAKADIHWVMREWVRQQPRIVRYLRGRAAAQIEGVMQEAMNGWEKSKRDTEEISVSTEGCDECNGTGRQTIAGEQSVCPTCLGAKTVRKERATIKGGKPGDAKFLKVALDCVRELNKLHDLYPQHKGRDQSAGKAHLAIDVEGNPYINLPADQLLQARAFLSRLAAPKDTSVVIDSHKVTEPDKG